MGAHGLITWSIIGGVAGWLAGLVMRGVTYGWIGDIVIGLAGAAISGWFYGDYFEPVGGGVLGTVAASAIGAIVLISFVRVFNLIV